MCLGKSQPWLRVRLELLFSEKGGGGAEREKGYRGEGRGELYLESLPLREDRDSDQ